MKSIPADAGGPASNQGRARRRRVGWTLGSLLLATGPTTTAGCAGAGITADRANDWLPPDEGGTDTASGGQESADPSSGTANPGTSAISTSEASGTAPLGETGTTTGPGSGTESAGQGDSSSGGLCMACDACGVEDPTPFEQTLLDLPADAWFAAPSSLMRSVCPAEPSLGDCQQVVAASGGGAYDSVRRRVLVFGGGHTLYLGNELYAFDLREGAWARLTEPSLPPEGTTAADFYNRDPLPDGNPVARHSYDGLEFLPDVDQLWAHGGLRAQDGLGTGQTWRFDPDEGWSAGTASVGGATLSTAYDTVTHKVFVHSTEWMSTYDVASDTWVAIPGWGLPPLWPRYAYGGSKTSTIDPRRRLFWTVGGNGNILVWDLDAGEAVTDDWVTEGGGEYSNADRVLPNFPDQVFESGGGDIYNAVGPGFDYDTAADAMVAWPNAGAPYVLDLDTKVWTLGSSEGAPPQRSGRQGTFGRWRYLAEYNVFILVNSVDQNVHFYKHTAGCGDE